MEKRDTTKVYDSPRSCAEVRRTKVVRMLIASGLQLEDDDVCCLVEGMGQLSRKKFDALRAELKATCAHFRTETYPSVEGERYAFRNGLVVMIDLPGGIGGKRGWVSAGYNYWVDRANNVVRR